MTLSQVLIDLKDLNDRGITFISGDKEDFVSYASLLENAKRHLSSLQKKGISAGDELVFQIQDDRQFVATFWACILGGIIPVPLSLTKNDGHRQKLFEVWKCLNNPHIFIQSQDLVKLHEYAERTGQIDECFEIRKRALPIEDATDAPYGIIHVAAPNDIAFIQFSSGSTGRPKGVQLTHENLISNIKAISAAAGYSKSDSLLSWMPLTHDMGLIGFHLNPLFCGINQYHIPTELFIRRPGMWLEKASEHQVTVLSSPNFGYNYFLRFSKAQDINLDLSTVRIIYNGAEPISQALSNKFLEHLRPVGLRSSAICPVYGLAEASVAVSISKVEDDVSSILLDRNNLGIGDKIKKLSQSEKGGVPFVNVGKPINYCLVKITDKAHEEVQNGIIGRILIKGDNVTSGYYNDIAATKKAITNDGWIKTGDIGFISEGCLYITGREKDIIFVNGQNYYAHDIEQESTKIEGIDLNKIVISGYFNNHSGQEEVLAFVLHRRKLQDFTQLAGDLKSIINQKFGFELNHVIPVPSIPKTTSGKLQRFELVKSYESGTFSEVLQELTQTQLDQSESVLVLPKSPTEKGLLHIWRQVLNTQEIGVDQNFFELGGNSLKGAEVVMNIFEAFKVELPIGIIHEKRTIQSLAAELEKHHKKTFQPISKHQATGFNATSSAQKRIFYNYLKDVDSLAYNIPVAFEVIGDLDLIKLQACIQQLVIRHDSLRMTFRMKEEPESIVHDYISITVELLKGEKELKNISKSFIRPFDLTNEPPYRVAYLTCESRDYLFMDFHHIAFDGISVYQFLSELWRLYEGAQLSSTRASYQDFVAWEVSRGSTKDYEKLRAFWSDEYAGGWPQLNLPTDHPRPSTWSDAGKKMRFQLNEATSRGLHQLAKKSDVTVHAVLLTLFHLFLKKITGQKDIVVGVPVAGRTHPDLLETIGMFVNNLAIRNVWSGDYSFLEMLQGINQKMKLALNHQEFLFEHLVALEDRLPDPSRAPVFDTMLLYDDMGTPENPDDTIQFSRIPFDTGTSKFDLSLEVIEADTKMQCAFEYATQLFTDETIAVFCRTFQQLTEVILGNPLISISKVSLLNRSDHERLTLSLTGSDHPFAPTTIHQLIEEQCRKTPDAIAVQEGIERISYKELNLRANGLADILKSKGVERGTLVALLLPNSIETIISILAILKTGGAYLPLDHTTPTERLIYVLDHSQSGLVLYHSNRAQIDHMDIAAEFIDLADVEKNDLHTSETSVKVASDDLAYVIYTSGSTGKPKGVEVSHDALINYIIWAARTYVGGEKASFPLYSSIAFDLTVTSIFTPLVTGNTIITYPNAAENTILQEVFQDDQIDIVKLTPSHLRLALNNKLFVGRSSIRKLIVGGEQLSSRLAGEVYDACKGKVAIYNEYGPTEATVGCMFYRFDPRDSFMNVPIGLPVDNTQVYLLDDDLNHVPDKVEGDLYISGRSLAKGYLFHPELTQDRFVANPFMENKRMYKTGDRAKRYADGNLTYIGREDNQVKIHGYRIELSEIEHGIRTYESVNDVAVLAVDTEELTRLHAYISVDPDASFDELVLKNHLTKFLPYYMIPSIYVFVEMIPLTVNGKVDVVQLQLLETTIPQRNTAELPQTDIAEAMIAVWETILGEFDISIDDNFFELGGDSIKAAQISSRLFDQGIAIEVKHILTYHTIRQINEFASYVNHRSTMDQGPVTGTFKMNPIQQWFFSNNFENPNYFNQSVLLESKKELDIRLLEQAFTILIDTHDGLRVNFDPKRSLLCYNENHLGLNFKIREFELGETRWDDDQSINNYIATKGQFNIENGLLINAAVIHRKGDASRLLITAHHLVVDGVSWRILLNDLVMVYERLLAKQETNALRKTASLKECTEKLYLDAKRGISKRDEDYWRAADDFNFTIPLDFETDDWRYLNRGSIVQTLDEAFTDTLLKKARSVYNADVLVLLDLSILLTLKEWTGRDKFVIETESHGRNIAGCDTTRTTGWFTSMYPILLNLESMQLSDQIKEVKEQLALVPDDGLSYGIRSLMQSNSKNDFRKRSQMRVNYLGDFTEEFTNQLFSFKYEFSGEEVDPANQITAVLEIEAIILNGTFQFTFHFNRKAHKEETVNTLAQETLANLKTILAHIREQETVHFTPSDFSSADLDEGDLEAIFG